MKKIVLRLFGDVMACLVHLERVPRPVLAMLVVAVSLVVTWFVYVPIHELLHAAGCLVTGGEVTRLEVAPQYGGRLLAEYFSFVVSGSDYAGQLTGFTRDSDPIYLATVFGPYVLTVVFGIPLLRSCTRAWHPVRLGAGIVVGLAPFYNLFGDYFEMGSILVTRLATVLGLGSGPLAYPTLRSDDVFKLVGEIFTSPEAHALSGAGDVATAMVLVLFSFLLGIILAFLTYTLGDLIATRAVWPTPPLPPLAGSRGSK